MEMSAAAVKTWVMYGISTLLVLSVVLGWRAWLRLFGIVVIPENTIGVINKKFVVFGQHRTLPDGAVIATHGEAGWQAATIPTGLHYWLWPWQYEIKRVPFLVIPEGKLGVVDAMDGRPLEPGRVLSRYVACDSFQDAVAFLGHNGERGPQMPVMPPGTYRVNPMLFRVTIVAATVIPDNMVGVVTAMEGATLPTGEIAGREVAGHNAYQNGQAFVDAGGFKGRQEQVLLAGRYFLNPRFVTVETEPLTEVPIANVGVVIAYVGEAGVDVTGDSFRHGNLVPRGRKGVWVDPMDPGKYPINKYTHRVEIVPTANVVLNWATGKTESHKLDANLSTITVRSSDGYPFNLDVSQIIHVPRNEAPRVIARFGNMQNLVTQVLEPTIGNYFRNAAQQHDAISFLKERQERQSEARSHIEKALEQYNVNAVDTLIGDINPPAELMKTLTDRKLAEQQKITFETQRLAEETRKELQQAKATADTQARVVDAERQVQIRTFEASAAVAEADGQARAKVMVAEADAKVLTTVGEAEAVKVRAVGTAEADVIKMKITSMEPGNYAAIEVSRALSQAKVPIVPEILTGSGSDGGGLVNVLLANMLHRNGVGLTDKAKV